MRFVVTMIADIIIVDLPDHRAVRPAVVPSGVTVAAEPWMVPAMMMPWSVPASSKRVMVGGMRPAVNDIMMTGRPIPFQKMAALFGRGKRMSGE